MSWTEGVVPSRMTDLADVAANPTVDKTADIWNQSAQQWQPLTKAAAITNPTDLASAIVAINAIIAAIKAGGMTA